MYKELSIIALIPARGGSKGLPGKNIKILNGKPLIAWTISQALASKYIDKVIVSTDSNKIASVSRKHGAEVPFIRPGKLATSKSNIYDAVAHALGWFRKRGKNFDIMVLLQPTSPLRNTKDIDNTIELLLNKKAKSIISVSQCEHNPILADKLEHNGRMSRFVKLRKQGKNRQEMPVYYRINGAIYTTYIDYYLSNKSFYGNATFSYIMPVERSVDIDNSIDFFFAEFLKTKGFK